jgi:hypothetical protein
MANPSLHHEQLRTRFTGVAVESHGISVQQYRGIRYGTVPGRFERAEPAAVSDTGHTVDAIRFGYVLLGR